jgi:hypothetical protein
MSAGVLRRGVWIAAAIVVIAAAVYFSHRLSSMQAFLPIVPSSEFAGSGGDLPYMPEKQVPASFELDGCPPEGEGGDPQLNLLKNRVDRGDYVTVPFDSLITLTWPKNVERQRMDLWPEPSRNFISRYAGLPIKVEGYIVSVREGPPDPAGCNSDSSSYLDWHLSFTKNPRDERTQSVLAEVTPRVRLDHRWTFDSIHSLIMGVHLPVRLSGWLYFDPEHPGDLGVTRATLWEINPVMQIEVLDGTRWVPLDSLAR